jgi:hypothetical protein
MKRIAYSFLLIALLSCGSHLASPGNRIRLQIRDSTIEDFFLLAVRNDAVVVSPFRDDDIVADVLIAHAHVISFAKTEAISYKPERSASILPGLGGCLIGTAAGCLLGGYSTKGEGDISTLLGYGTVGGTAGFAAGMLIAIALKSQPDDKVIYDIKSHTDELRDHAIYYDQEPPELQKIK